MSAHVMVHTPMLNGRAGEAPAGEEAEVERAWSVLRDELLGARPDYLVLVMNEHLNNAFYPYMAPFTLGVAPFFTSVAEPVNKLDSHRIPSDESVSEAMLRHLWEVGVDVGFSHDLRLDHGAMVPLLHLVPELNLPVIPIFQLTAREPRPPLRRCYALGAGLASFVAARPSDERVAFVGTGGLSHWVGTSRMGEVNAAWDLKVLDDFCARRDEQLLSMSDAEIELAGNGAHEVRNWITVAGAVPGCPGVVVSAVEYERVWTMGTSHLRFVLPASTRSESIHTTGTKEDEHSWPN